MTAQPYAAAKSLLQGNSVSGNYSDKFCRYEGRNKIQPLNSLKYTSDAPSNSIVYDANLGASSTYNRDGSFYSFNNSLYGIGSAKDSPSKSNSLYSVLSAYK